VFPDPCAGFPVAVIVKVYVPAVVPRFLLPPPPLPPQPAMVPRTTISTNIPSIDRQLRRRAGIPKNSNSASTAPPPAPIQPLPGPSFGRTSSLLLAAVVSTVTVAVPVVVVELSVTVWLPFVQLGRSVAPDGDEVSAQVSVTLPA